MKNILFLFLFLMLFSSHAHAKGYFYNQQLKANEQSEVSDENDKEFVPSENLGVYLAARGSLGFSGYGIDSTFPRGWLIYTESGKTYDAQLGGTIAVGYDFYDRFNLPLRIELDSSYHSEHQGESVLYSSVTYNYEVQPTFLNIYYTSKPTNTSSNRYYIGGGIGTSNNEFYVLDGSTIYKADSTTSFAFNFTVGAIYPLTNTLAFDFGARLAFIASPEEEMRIYSDTITPEGGFFGNIYIGIQAKF